MRSPHTRLAIAATALALTLTGCGSDDGAPVAEPAVASEPRPSLPSPSEASTAPSTPAGEQEAEAVEAQLVDFAVELGADSFAAGTYQFAVTNTGDASHDFVVEQGGEEVAATAVLQPGQTETLTVDLEPGTYTFYCSVGNHRAMGMEVTVEVTA